jgi:hypothetical protein
MLLYNRLHERVTNANVFSIAALLPDIGVTNNFWSRSRHGHGRDVTVTVRHENTTEGISAISFGRQCAYVSYR